MTQTARRELDPVQLRRRLLAWYDGHRRTLPWRAPPGERADPYRVWVSEIMLQQTRVAAAIPYFERFLARFPDVSALAGAREAEVLNLWSGLGYYRRARQLRQAAQCIVARHDGRLPLAEANLRALPGIGEYTAGAILSIADNQPYPAADGNAVRIVQRMRGREATLPQARHELARWLAPRRPGDFNQALMDLGATVCLPRTPECARCPLRHLCASAGQPPPPPPRRRPERVVLHYGLVRRGARVWLRQRAEDAAQMPGLWELPSLAQAPPTAEPLLTVRHAITTRRITAHVHALEPPPPPGRWAGPRDLERLPLTGLARKILHATRGVRSS